MANSTAMERKLGKRVFTLLISGKCEKSHVTPFFRKEIAAKPKAGSCPLQLKKPNAWEDRRHYEIYFYIYVCTSEVNIPDQTFRWKKSNLSRSILFKKKENLWDQGTGSDEIEVVVFPGYRVTIINRDDPSTKGFKK